LTSDTKTNKFWYILEPLTREIWYYFSSFGKVYAAQQSPAGRFLLGLDGPKQTWKSTADPRSHVNRFTNDTPPCHQRQTVSSH